MFHVVPHENAPGFSRGSVPGRPNHWKEGGFCFMGESPESWDLRFFRWFESLEIAWKLSNPEKEKRMRKSVQNAKMWCFHHIFQVFNASIFYGWHRDVIYNSCLNLKPSELRRFHISSGRKCQGDPRKTQRANLDRRSSQEQHQLQAQGYQGWQWHG